MDEKEGEGGDEVGASGGGGGQGWWGGETSRSKREEDGGSRASGLNSVLKQKGLKDTTKGVDDALPSEGDAKQLGKGWLLVASNFRNSMQSLHEEKARRESQLGEEARSQERESPRGRGGNADTITIMSIAPRGAAGEEDEMPAGYESAQHLSEAFKTLTAACAKVELEIAGREGSVSPSGRRRRGEGREPTIDWQV